jgi:hypothetical protein
MPDILFDARWVGWFLSEVLMMAVFLRFASCGEAAKVNRECLVCKPRSEAPPFGHGNGVESI